MLFMTSITAGSLFYSLLGVPKDVFHSTPARFEETTKFRIIKAKFKLCLFLAVSIAFYSESVDESHCACTTKQRKCFQIISGNARVDEINDGTDNEIVAAPEKKICSRV